MSRSALEARWLEADPVFGRLARRLDEGRSTSAGGLWGTSQAWVLAALVERAPGPWLVLVANEAELESVRADLSALGVDALPFPARAAGGGRGAQADADAVRARLQVAQRLGGPAERRPRVLVASVLSMLQPVPSPDTLEGEFLHLQVGQRLDDEDVVGRLVGAGYTRQPLAEAPGEVSLRGDILDLYPFAAELPVRVELFDEEVDSVRTYDPGDQRSVEKLDRVSLCVAADAGGVEDGRGAQPAELLAPDAVWVTVEPLRVVDAQDGLRVRSSAHAHALTTLEAAAAARVRLDLQSLPGDDLVFETRSVQALAVGVPRAAQALREAHERGERAVLLCRTEAEQKRVRASLEEHGGVPELEHALGSVSKGFRMPHLGLLVVNHRELAGAAEARRAAQERPKHRVRALQSFFELRTGDLVVHAVHGVALFKGLEKMPRGGAEEEHLSLVFADDVSLFVPASRIDLVQRYVGSGAKAPPLDKLGGASFRRRKEKVERALVDLAADLLEVQALRETNRREPWPADDELVRDVVAAFPHTDTSDQVEVDGEIRRDLASARPLDRLLCGDVGFGKTEMALRAAARVVAGGGQVAVLVPTTVLADQHHRTFARRFSGFPVEVRRLSRHVKGKERKQLLDDLEAGRVDIAIGTHRLLSKDVRFKRLGLVVIDEEQRFGVSHKEHFKRLRATVDVLALSATPIPRTLHMSLAGVRDISALSVPPAGRQDVETVLEYRENLDLVRDVLVREKARGGQTFFLHNRVHSIEATADALRQLVPECTFEVGHGQMVGDELSQVMGRFIRGEADVLVSTTIVENGIDIPSAGTILVDRADTFGLSELHQLRGRVGRGAQKSWCFLLVEKGRPMARVARERLEALVEMSHLGAGFDISMKDLEIRGAGNILGPEQSGHIAAIGYDMYCRLLKQTVEGLREVGDRAAYQVGAPPPADRPVDAGEVEVELGLPSFLPNAWIPEQATRLELLRQLDAVRSDADADAVRAVLRDRFGRLPAEAETLVRMFRLRWRLAEAGISGLAAREEGFLIHFRDRVSLESALGAGVELRPLRSGQAILVPGPEAAGRGPEAALAWLEARLQRDEPGRIMAAETPS